MKYIRTNENQIVIFSTYYSHSEIARKFDGAKSAGFIVGIGSGIDDLKCTGESVSLGIKSHPDDTEILLREIRGY